MNILFYSPFDVSPEKGGTERITISVSEALRQMYGHKCFLAYGVEIDGKYEKAYFDGRVKIPYDANIELLKDAITNFEIDVVIIQGAFNLVPKFRNCIGKDSHIRILFVHHFEPGWERFFFTIHDAVGDVRESRTLKEFLRKTMKVIFYRHFKAKHDRKVSLYYKRAYDNADNIVLLSKNFFKMFQKECGAPNCDKMIAIPNMLSFDFFADDDCVQKKEKMVLIVSRLEETQKRISLALDVWDCVKKNDCAKGWSLHVLGGGRDENFYKRMVKKNKIPDVFFHGVVDPREMYLKASLFMMTSRSEGWGLTLTEAMQYGVVPIAFDSYASLHDIIVNGENGYVVLDGCVREYANILLDLMNDSKRRMRLAHNAVALSGRFSPDEIVPMWNDLLH